MRRPDLYEKELAELIGILLGDGSIGKYEWQDKTQYRVKVTSSGDETAFVSQVKGLFEDLFHIEPLVRDRGTENVRELQIFGKELFDFLTETVGLKPAPKWGRAIIPDMYLSNGLEKYVLRGYFDTDGSVVLTDNNGILYPRLEMKICPAPMQKQIQGILESRMFRFGSYGIGDGKVRLQMNGEEQLRKWWDEIGFRNPKHRKKAEIAGGGFEPPASGL